MGNDKPVLTLIQIWQVIFGLVLSGPSFAWQTPGPVDTTLNINTPVLLDSLPDLKAISYFDDLKNSMDSLRSWQVQLDAYQHTGDSLTTAQLQKILTLKENGDSLLYNLETRQKQAETRLNRLESKATHLQDSLHQALQKKVRRLRSGGKLSPKADSLWNRLDQSFLTEKLKDPTGQLENSGNRIGEMDQLLGQLKQENISPEFSENIEGKLSELQSIMQEKEQLASLKTGSEALKSNFNEKLQQLNQNLNPDFLSRHQQQLQQYTGQIKTYQDQVNNVPETLEQKARGMEEMEAFESQKAAFNPYQEQMEQLGKEEYAKEQVAQKAKTMAKDHFAGQQEKLLAAQSRLTKLKKKMGKLGGGGLNGEKIKRENTMKGKTLGERLVFGGNFQLHPGEEVSLDISPTLAYRWTKMFRLGLGGTYRTTFDEKEKFFLSDENEVFGFRGFAEHDVYKGFFAHIEYERLKGSHGLVQNGTVGDGNSDPWQNGALAGVGKRYKIRNKIKGNVMLLYNFLFERVEGTNQNGHEGLYRGPWNLRFGFELIGQGSKKQKKEETKKQ